MTVRAVYVPLSADEMEALKALGRREDRDPRRQAKRILREGLEHAGVLPIEVKDYYEVRTNAGDAPARAGTAR